MSAFAPGLMPLAGTIGDIRLGDASPVGSVFGQYEVISAVPEVETVLQSLLFVGLFVAFKGRGLLSRYAGRFFGKRVERPGFFKPQDR